MARHNETGRYGELVALSWFEKQGYQIIERNWRAGHLEIDLIAGKEGVVYFIEVKTSRSIKHGYPEQRITRKKWLNIRRASMSYLRSHPHRKQIGYLILSILLASPAPQFFLIEDGFLF